MLGLSIGIIAGPSGTPQAGMNTPSAAALASVEDSHIRTAPVLEHPPEMILASATPPTDPVEEHTTAAPPSSAKAPAEVSATYPEKKRNLKVRSGDTLMSIMLSAGIDRDDANGAVTALRAVYDPKDLRVGQRIHLTLSKDTGLTEMRLDPSVLRQIAVRRDNATSFRAFETERTLTRQVDFAQGVIKSSLYKAAVKKDVPLSVLSELIRIYSWDVDFQREIQSGDRFEVAYERFVDDEGAVVRHGEVIFARLNLSGDQKALYRFETRAGHSRSADYFDEKGRSAKRPLLRTPIDGARLSSRFGKRRHPVLGYTKMHRGVDFAAATGTPIYAAGDGVISFRGRKGGYGKYVGIRHAGGYHTAYAHMSRFKKGVTQGSRVRQGEVIGYVGTTGRSTGPHLHYEILASGRQVNPLTVKMPSGIKLGKKQFARFQANRASIDAVVAGIRKETIITRR